MFKPILHSIRMTHGETYQCTNCSQHCHLGDYRIQMWVWKWFHKRSRCLLGSDFLYFATEEHKPICASSTLHCVCLAHTWVLGKSFWLHAHTEDSVSGCCKVQTPNTRSVCRGVTRGRCEIAWLLGAPAQVEHRCRRWWPHSIGLFSPRSCACVGQTRAVTQGRQCQCLREQVEAEF